MTGRSAYSFLLPLMVGALASVTGCAPEKSGLPYDTLRIAVERSEGTSIAGFPRCVTLPVLNGSAVEERHAIEGGLSLEVFATESSVALTFVGAGQGAALDRTISAERLRASFAESFTVTNVGGAPFTVDLGSNCATSDAR